MKISHAVWMEFVSKEMCGEEEEEIFYFAIGDDFPTTFLG